LNFSQVVVEVEKKVFKIGPGDNVSKQLKLAGLVEGSVVEGCRFERASVVVASGHRDEVAGENFPPFGEKFVDVVSFVQRLRSIDGSIESLFGWIERRIGVPLSKS